MINHKTKIHLLLIVIVSLLIGCSSPYIEEAKSEVDGLQTWVGEYKFYEYSPPDLNMEYTVIIYKENEAYHANIEINGFSTEIKAKAKVSGEEDSIALIFENYLYGNLNNYYSEGDTLLRLKKLNSELHTYWGKVKPILNENDKSGRVYFVKQ